jgi:hypothetical protein
MHLSGQDELQDSSDLDDTRQDDAGNLERAMEAMPIWRARNVNLGLTAG